jgi:hypothetical protein
MEHLSTLDGGFFEAEDPHVSLAVGALKLATRIEPAIARLTQRASEDAQLDSPGRKVSRGIGDVVGAGR